MSSKSDGVRWTSQRERLDWERLAGPRIHLALQVAAQVIRSLGYACVVTRFVGGPPSPVHTAARALDLRSHHVRPGDIPRILDAVNEALPSPWGDKAPTMIWETPREEDRARVQREWKGAEVPLIVSDRATAEHFHLQVPGGLLRDTVWDQSTLPCKGVVP